MKVFVKTIEHTAPWKLRAAFAAMAVLILLGGGIAAEAEDAAVEISGFAFKPQVLTVPVGTKVTWTNQDNAAHIVAGKGDGFRSEKLGKGTPSARSSRSPAPSITSAPSTRT